MNNVTLKRFWSKVDMDNPRGCWEWTAGVFDNGYGSFRMDAKNYRAHRLAWSICNGEIPDGMIVMHTCDNPLCCNPTHLKIGTHRENTLDMYDKKRKTKNGSSAISDRMESIKAKRGKRNKVTDSQVVLIRALVDGGVKISVLAEIFHITKCQIWNIATCKAHGNVVNYNEVPR